MTDSEQPATASPPKKTMGRYELLALLAMGGMAEIYLARLTGLRGFERLAVVKRIRPHLAKEPRFVDMFIHEARLAARLNHGNIVQIYDLGRDGEDFYIAMEYLDGENLAYLVQRCATLKRSLPVELSASILAQVCDGLDYAHHLTDEAGNALGLIHRDVSPQNIIVQYDGAVKLVDFGIAKAAGSSSTTKVGTLKGKVAYMSPEQCIAGSMDLRADVFSLGVVLWELLARRRLYKREHDVATLHAIVYGPVPPVRAIRPDVPAALDKVAQRALQKEPAERYATAGEMGEALREALRVARLRAGPREVSAFMGEVFAERAARRRSVVEQALAFDGRQVMADELRQDTGESMPSGSHERAALEAPVDGEIIDQGPPEEDEEAADTQLGTRPGASPRPAPDEAAGQAEEPPDTAVGARPAVAAGAEEDEPPSTAVGARPRGARPEPGLRRVQLLIGAAVGGILLLFLGVVWALSGGEPDPRPSGPEPMSAPDAGLPGVAVAPLQAADAEAPDTVLDAGLAEAAPDAGLPEGGLDAGLVARPPARVAVETMPPGCQVAVDGKTLDGTTPLEGIDLEPDVAHQFKVACRGYSPEERSLTLASGEGELLEFSMRALPGAAAQPVGYLKVNSVPWSEVFLGRTKLGTTPLLRVRLPAGRYNLLLVNPDSKVKKNVPVVIRAGRVSTVVEQL
jgi:tRNA A-37 threonylcarbamoyl transferase component Bud32